MTPLDDALVPPESDRCLSRLVARSPLLFRGARTPRWNALVGGLKQRSNDLERRAWLGRNTVPTIQEDSQSVATMGTMVGRLFRCESVLRDASFGKNELLYYCYFVEYLPECFPYTERVVQYLHYTYLQHSRIGNTLRRILVSCISHVRPTTVVGACCSREVRSKYVQRVLCDEGDVWRLVRPIRETYYIQAWEETCLVHTRVGRKSSNAGAGCLRRPRVISFFNFASAPSPLFP